MKMKRLKAGVIGLGVGEAHIQGYQNHPDCEVVGICDFSDNKMSYAKEKYPNIRVTNRADDLLQDTNIDIISIASYDNYHHKQIIQAISNNKHIFVEKPLCLYRDEALEIRQCLQEKPRLKISSNLILRMAPRFRQLKGMITDDVLGHLFYIDGAYNYGRLHKITEGWRGKADFYSVVYGGGVHIIDLMLWLTGDIVTEVSAYGNAIASRDSGFKYNDMVVAILKFESGMIGKVASNFGCVHPHFHAIDVYGTEGTFTNGLETGTLYESGDQSCAPETITSEYPTTDKSYLTYNFVDSILNRSEPEVTADDIFKAMSVCFAIEKATDQSGPVNVEYI